MMYRIQLQNLDMYSDYYGGKILEFSADKCFDAGKAEGEQKLANLVSVLLTNGKTDEIARAANDREYRALLYKKYAIV